MDIQGNKKHGKGSVKNPQLEKAHSILRDYPADQRDGFVSNIDSYAEQRCKDLGIPELTPEVSKLLKHMKP